MLTFIYFRKVSRLLFAYGDVESPLPETVRVLDEIVTEFLEGVCFEASRHAQVAGRQKLKFDDFEFALRRSPTYLGKVRSMIDKRQHIASMRSLFKENDDDIIASKEHGDGKDKDKGKEKDKSGGGGAGKKAGARSATQADEEELLGLSDDDGEVMSALTSTTKGGRKKRKKDGGK